MLVVSCPHCSWWGFAHADELGPRDAVRALLRHLESSHPLNLSVRSRAAAPSDAQR